MRRPAEFKSVFAQGRRTHNEFFTVRTRANALTGARLGMSIAARTMKRAVDRNRLRRLIRESFRMHQHILPPVDIVIGTHAATKGADPASIRASLEQLWQKIAASCGNSSKS